MNAANVSGASSGPVFWVGVVLPYAVVVPNWKKTFVAAPAGLTEPTTVADEVVTADAAPVVGVPGGRYAPANRPRGLVPLVYRKNGVPIAPP